MKADQITAETVFKSDTGKLKFLFLLFVLFAADVLLSVFTAISIAEWGFVEFDGSFGALGAFFVLLIYICAMLTVATIVNVVRILKVPDGITVACGKVVVGNNNKVFDAVDVEIIPSKKKMYGLLLTLLAYGPAAYRLTFICGGKKYVLYYRFEKNLKKDFPYV